MPEAGTDTDTAIHYGMMAATIITVRISLCWTYSRHDNAVALLKTDGQTDRRTDCCCLSSWPRTHVHTVAPRTCSCRLHGSDGSWTSRCETNTQKAKQIQQAFIACPMLSNALHSSIGQTIKSFTRLISDLRCSECEKKLQMAITQQGVVRSTSRLVLGRGFFKDGLAVNLTAHELHEIYHDMPTSQKGIGQTPCSFEHACCTFENHASAATVGGG